jgi:type II secretory pathway component PulM
MVGTLLKWGGLLVICILVYNFFFGDSAEKESSRKIFGEMRTLVVSVGGLMKNEKAKFDAGKYDAVLDKLGGAYRTVRERAQFVDEKVLKRLDELEQRKAELDAELQSIEAADQAANTPAPAPKKGLKKDPKAEEQKAAKAADQQRRKDELRRELEVLLQDSDALLEAAAK